MELGGTQNQLVGLGASWEGLGASWEGLGASWESHEARWGGGKERERSIPSIWWHHRISSPTGLLPKNIHTHILKFVSPNLYDYASDREERLEFRS